MFGPQVQYNRDPVDLGLVQDVFPQPHFLEAAGIPPGNPENIHAFQVFPVCPPSDRTLEEDPTDSDYLIVRRKSDGSFIERLPGPAIMSKLLDRLVERKRQERLARASTA